MKSIVNQKTSRTQGMPAQLSLSFNKPLPMPRTIVRPKGVSKTLKKLQAMKGKEWLFNFKNYIISDFIVSADQVLILTRGGKNLIFGADELKAKLKEFLRVDAF